MQKEMLNRREVLLLTTASAAIGLMAGAPAHEHASARPGSWLASMRRVRVPPPNAK
jgi:hypothetical protein